MPTLGFNQTAPEEWKETLSNKGRNLLQGDRSLEHGHGLQCYAKLNASTGNT